MALGVVGVQRLFDPDEVELLEDAAHPLRGRAVPLLVGVNHQGDVVTKGLADRGHPGDVQFPVGLADLELDGADAQFQRAVRVLDDLVDRRVQEPAGGVVGLHRITVRTKQFGHRQAGALGLEVPQRDVDGGDGLGGHPAAPDGGAGPDEFGPDLGDIAGILTDENGGDLLGVGELGGAAGALGVAEADPFVAAFGADLGEEEHHLGHRLLAAGQHFGVADRIRQRQDDRGQLDRGDLVDRCGAGRERISRCARELRAVRWV